MTHALIGRVHARRNELLVASIFVLAALFRTCGLASQPVLEDEALTAFTADHYVEHGQFGPIEPFHPNLRNLVLYASTHTFGTGVVGLRGPSVLMGVLGVALLFALVLRLTKNRPAALLADLFLAIDPVHITFSRQSLQEVHTTFLFLLGTYCFVRAYDDDWQLAKPLWWIGAGVAFGLSVASKHHGLFPLVACAGVGVALAIRRRQWSVVALAVSTLAVLPATVYLMTYIPWFERGYGLGDWWFMQRALVDEMIAHTGYATSQHFYAHAWQWFVNPLCGYGNFTIAGGHPAITIAIGNPLFWLPVLPAAVFLMRRDRRSAGVLFLALLFWSSYLPLVVSPRPIWLLSANAVTPFAFALVAIAACSVGLPQRRRLMAAFVAAAVAVTLLLYPLAAARGWDYEYLRPLVEHFNPHPGGGGPPRPG